MSILKLLKSSSYKCSVSCFFGRVPPAVERTGGPGCSLYLFIGGAGNTSIGATFMGEHMGEHAGSHLTARPANKKDAIAIPHAPKYCKLLQLVYQRFEMLLFLTTFQKNLLAISHS